MMPCSMTMDMACPHPDHQPKDGAKAVGGVKARPTRGWHAYYPQEHPQNKAKSFHRFVDSSL